MRFSQYCERRLVMEMSDGDALERAIVAHPMDATPWGVYADWLDENNDPKRAGIARQVMNLLSGHYFGAMERIMRGLGFSMIPRTFTRHQVFFENMAVRFPHFVEWWSATTPEFRRQFSLQYYWEYYLPEVGEEGNQVMASITIDPAGDQWPDAMLRAMDRRCVEDLPPDHHQRVVEEVRDNLEMAGWTPGQPVVNFIVEAGASPK